MTLTAKQEKFAQAVANGVSQADAYRTAFNAQSMKNETIHKRSSELAGNGAVKGRIEELRKALEKKELWTREMSVRALVKAYKVAESTSNSGAMTGAVKELNVMHGFNAPLKIDHSSSDGTMTPAQLTDEQLIKIINGHGKN